MTKITSKELLFAGVIVFLRIVSSTKAKRGSNYGVTPKTTPKRETGTPEPRITEEDDVLTVTRTEATSSNGETNVRCRSSEQNGKTELN